MCGIHSYISDYTAGFFTDVFHIGLYILPLDEQFVVVVAPFVVVVAPFVPVVAQLAVPFAVPVVAAAEPSRSVAAQA